MFKFKEIDEKPADIWRVFIAGSSSAGKTYFANQLLAANLFKCKRVYYHHPDLKEEFPVNWNKSLNKQVIYTAGLPSEDDLLCIPHYSCVVLDDLYAEACESKTIDYLFRVLSSKRKLHVIILTQRYFHNSQGGLNIRNCSNYHVLMSNSDERTNKRVALSMNLKKEFNVAVELNRHKLYPYIFIDRTNYGRVLGIQIYTDIFSRSKQAIFQSMPSYVVSESDFKAYFKVIDNNLAVQNGVDKKTNENEWGKNKQCGTTTKKAKNYRNSTNIAGESDGESSGGASDGEGGRKKGDTLTGYQNYRRRKQLEKQVGKIIQRYKIRTKL